MMFLSTLSACALILKAPIQDKGLVSKLCNAKSQQTRLHLLRLLKDQIYFEALLFLFQGEVVAESKQEAEAVAMICDWSSRPENVPPAAFIIKRSKRNRMRGKNDKEMNTNLLKLLIPSLVLTHILMLGLG